MENSSLTGFIPKSHNYLWLFYRAGLLLWGIYGLFHGSVVEFIQAIFAIIFTHLWDFFQIFGGKSFITKVDYMSQTMLNTFIFIGVVIGSTLNNRTDFHDFDIVTHFFAGFISAWFAYDLAVIIQGKRGKISPALASIFCLCFALSISVGWEIYEFSMDRIYGMQLQRSIPTSEIGLLDTMFDFICDAIGAIIGMFLVAFYKNGLLGKHKKELRAKIKKEEQLEELKNRLLEDYLNGNDQNIN
ncbi:MAG: hypothetical protein RR552_02345 [Oscillospiraceae bacterium]